MRTLALSLSALLVGALCFSARGYAHGGDPTPHVHIEVPDTIEPDQSTITVRFQFYNVDGAEFDPAKADELAAEPLSPRATYRGQEPLPWTYLGMNASEGPGPSWEYVYQYEIESASLLDGDEIEWTCEWQASTIEVVFSAAATTLVTSNVAPHVHFEAPPTLPWHTPTVAIVGRVHDFKPQEDPFPTALYRDGPVPFEVLDVIVSEVDQGYNYEYILDLRPAGLVDSDEITWTFAPINEEDGLEVTVAAVTQLIDPDNPSAANGPHVHLDAPRVLPPQATSAVLRARIHGMERHDGARLWVTYLGETAAFHPSNEESIRDDYLVLEFEVDLSFATLQEDQPIQWTCEVENATDVGIHTASTITLIDGVAPTPRLRIDVPQWIGTETSSVLVLGVVEGGEPDSEPELFVGRSGEEPSTVNATNVTALGNGDRVYAFEADLSSLGLQSGDEIIWMLQGTIESVTCKAMKTSRLGDVGTPPVPHPQVIATSEGTPIEIELTGFDADDDALSFVVLTGPSNGTLSGTAPSIVYTPTPGFVGIDGITFTVWDSWFRFRGFEWVFFLVGEGWQQTITLEIVNPTPPSPTIQTPAAAPAFTGNEFTYTAVNPGVLTIPVRVRILPDTRFHQFFYRRRSVKITIDAIDDSHTDPAGGDVRLSWSTPFPGEPTAGLGVYNAVTHLWESTVTFTGLPPDNDDFGRKTTAAELVGAQGVNDTAELEVFFPRDATNHADRGVPDLGNFSATIVDTAGRGASSRSRNYFFYWNQTAAGDANARYDSTLATIGAGTTGLVPAGYDWLTYTGARERILVRHDLNAHFIDTTNATGTTKTGIDRFADTILHEDRHRTQVLESNALGPHVSVSVGWSWADGGVVLTRTVANVAAGRYNHFQAGPDGLPGVAGVDDDGDGATDERDEFMAGPGGTVVGDDVDLDPDGDMWGIVATEPDPNQAADGDGVTVTWNGLGWLENSVSGAGGSQSNRAETTVQDSFRDVDWGSPGKQHGPELAAPNGRGELNAFDD